MARSAYTRPSQPPPDFAAATNLRQRARAAGMDPNHWYAVATTAQLPPGSKRQVRFWRRDVAVFRGEDGALGAVEDRCAHRQLPLTAGEVHGCRIVCAYHGWAHDAQGQVVDIPHETFGRKGLRFRVDSFEVRERYGLVWVFFGDRDRARDTPLPVIPELEGPDPWPCVPLEYRWEAHHSMVLDNVSDYTHGWLHRRLEPFRDPKLLAVEADEHKVVVRYDTKIGAGKWMDPFIHRNALGSNTIELQYDYPYHRSDTDGHIKHFIAVLPEDERTTRAFFLLFYKQIRIPGTPWSVPRRLMKQVIRFGNRFIVDPVFAEDGAALVLEQRAWERHWDAPLAELNPQVKAFQELTIRKWEAWLASQPGVSGSTPEGVRGDAAEEAG